MKKIEINKGKLSLNKQTVASLNEVEMKTIKGGAFNEQTTSCRCAK